MLLRFIHTETERREGTSVPVASLQSKDPSKGKNKRSARGARDEGQREGG